MAALSLIHDLDPRSEGLAGLHNKLIGHLHPLTPHGCFQRLQIWVMASTGYPSNDAPKAIIRGIAVGA